MVGDQGHKGPGAGHVRLGQRRPPETEREGHRQHGRVHGPGQCRKKHWTQSQNLEKPWHRAPNDRKYTRRQLDKIAKLPEDSEEFVRFWEKQYRGWELVECEKSFNEQTGWYFYLTMRRAHIKQNGGLK